MCIRDRYYGTDFAKVDDITPPKIDLQSKQVAEEVKDWEEFAGSLPVSYKQAGFEGYGYAPSKLKNLYREYCRRRFKNCLLYTSYLHASRQVGLYVLHHSYS